MLGRSGLVALGIGVSGIGTLLMLSLVAHRSDASTFAAFASWWILATLATFPLGAFEVLLARLVVSDVASGNSTQVAVATITGRALFVATLVATGFAVADSALADNIFQGNEGLGLAVALYLLVATAQVLQRAHATGSDRFGLICAQLVTDGVFRLVGVGVSLQLADNSATGAALGVCAGAALSVLATHMGSTAWLQFPRFRNRGVPLAPVLLLLISSVGPLLINNASVPWLSSQGSDTLLVGSFAAAITLARLPLQLSSAVIGPLLNRISHAVETGDTASFGQLRNRAVSWSIFGAACFVASFGLLGPWVLHLYVGRAYELPTLAYLVLGASSGIMLVSIVVQTGVAARQLWMRIGLSWSLAAFTFAIVLATPISVLHRAAFAPLAASLVALLCLVAATLSVTNHD